MATHNSAARRNLFIREAISEALLDNTFEGSVLSAIFPDASQDLPQTGQADSHLLGCRDMAGEGEITFHSETDLAQFLEAARESGSRTALALLPTLERLLANMKADSSLVARLHLAKLVSADGLASSLSVAELLQDLLIHHGDQCEHGFFTLLGSFSLEDIDPAHLGGFAFFITADDIQHISADAWANDLVQAHLQQKQSGPSI